MSTTRRKKRQIERQVPSLDNKYACSYNVLMRMRYLSLFLLLVSCVSGFIIDIPITKNEYVVVDEQGYDRLICENASFTPYAPGYPEIPVFVCSYLIPRDQIAKNIVIKDEEWIELPGEFSLFPIQASHALETTGTFHEPIREIYQSREVFPSQPIYTFTCGTMRGYRILQIAIAAFQYIPAEKRLLRLERIVLDIECEYSPPVQLIPFRISRYGKQLCELFLSKTVINREAVYDHRFVPHIPVEENRTDSLPSDLPSLLGPPVDMVIITTNTQADAYGKYADFKKLSGCNTAVRTLPWIRQHYSGFDDADRIRNFVREAVQYWGVTYVLLGGDPPDIPTRYIWVDRSVIYPSLWLPIASDLYFSDLDGNWNGDGDEKFGELADSLDLYPDVFVGRVPTSSALAVDEYASKVKSYCFPEHTFYQTRALFFSSFLAANWPGLPYAFELANRLPDYFSKLYLSEYDGNLTIEALYDSIHAGFGIVTGVGHGDVNTMCYHYNSPRAFFNNFFYDSLGNNDLYSLMVVVTCYTNPFQSDCLGEHWVLNPDGGGVAYIGPTSSSEGSIHKEYMKLLYDSLCTLPLGQAFALAKTFFVPNAFYSNWHRVHQFSLSLLGDPTLRIWDRSPQQFSGVIVEPETLTVGSEKLKFEVNPMQTPTAMEMLLYKENELFVRDSVVHHRWKYDIETRSTGYLKFVLRSRGFIPYLDSIKVIPGAPYLSHHDHTIIDSAGNANSVINPGEQISFFVSVSNNGGAPATNVHAQLLCSDSLLTMVNDTSSYPDIAAGTIAENSAPFTFTVSSTMPDEYSFEFEIVLDYSSSISSDSLQVIGCAPNLQYFRQTYANRGDTLLILPYLFNMGHESADSIVVTIERLTDSIIVLDSVAHFPAIAVREIISSAPDSLSVFRQYPGCEVRLRVTLQQYANEIMQFTIIQSDVPLVSGLRIDPNRQSIGLEWESVPGTRGYRVYRSLTPSGPYEFCMNRLAPVCRFEDFDVAQGIDYYYCVEAVDSSMNQGVTQDTVCGRTNPSYATGWPQEVYEYQYGGPNFGEIDPFYPGLEIVATGQESGIYIWHSDGTPVVGQSALVLDVGDGKIWSSPAVGDVNGDGRTDIVFGVQRGFDNLYVLSYNNVCDSVVIHPGWPKDLQSGGLVSSPVLVDIDDDDDLEILAMTVGPARLYVLHHDGSGVFDTTGILKNFAGISFGTPAVGDINDDGNKEIIALGGETMDSLFVWDRYGEYVAPFPVEIAPDNQAKYSTIIGDVLGDACREICVYIGPPSNMLVLVDINGTVLWQHQFLSTYIDMSAAMGDMNSDGSPEIVFGYHNGLNAGVLALDSLGNVLTGFPITGHDAFTPIIADMTGDGRHELVCGSTEWNVHAYDFKGARVSGFPIKLGMIVGNSQAIFDVDMDGTLELLVGGFDLKFHVFDVNTQSFDWPRFHYDPYNSGCYKSGYYSVREHRLKNPLSGARFMVYPNPFHDHLIIEAALYDQDISCRIYDITGRLVRYLILPATERYGTPRNLVWNGVDNMGRTVPCGVYFLQLSTDGYETIHKVIRIR